MWSLLIIIFKWLLLYWNATFTPYVNLVNSHWFDLYSSIRFHNKTFSTHIFFLMMVDHNLNFSILTMMNAKCEIMLCQKVCATYKLIWTNQQFSPYLFVLNRFVCVMIKKCWTKKNLTIYSKQRICFDNKY